MLSKSSIIIILYIMLSLGVIVYQYFETEDLKRNLEMHFALQYMLEWNETFTRMEGVHYKGIICIDADRTGWAEFMEICNHEFLHYQDRNMRFGENCHFKSTRGC